MVRSGSKDKNSKATAGGSLFNVLNVEAGEVMEERGVCFEEDVGGEVIGEQANGGSGPMNEVDQNRMSLVEKSRVQPRVERSVVDNPMVEKGEVREYGKSKMRDLASGYGGRGSFYGSYYGGRGGGRESIDRLSENEYCEDGSLRSHVSESEVALNLTSSSGKEGS